MAGILNKIEGALHIGGGDKKTEEAKRHEELKKHEEAKKHEGGGIAGKLKETFRVGEGGEKNQVHDKDKKNKKKKDKKKGEHGHDHGHSSSSDSD